jgi:hypothetical protein
MRVLASIAVCLCAVSCGGSSSSPATVAITAPAAGSTITLGTDADKSVPVSFTTTNFTVQPPGSCSNSLTCGHVHLLIDGPTGCINGTLAYDNELDAPSGATNVAKFARCATATGAHVISLELHDDHHAPVASNGAVISASVSVTTK